MTARTPQRQHLLDLLAPVIASCGYDLDDVTVTAAGRRSLIRVTVDGDNGIDLDAVAEISRAVSELLDEAEGGAFAGPYVLEVSSPGVDRPLTEPRHWRRAVGRLVTVAVGEDTITGRVVSGGDLVALDVDGTVKSWPFEALGKGKVQVEFNHKADLPGGGAIDDDFEEDFDDLDEDLDEDFDGDDPPIDSDDSNADNDDSELEA